MPFTQYLKELRKHLRLGDATEHTHRAALAALLEELGERIIATNEPKQTAVGAPDFIIRRGDVPLGYVECKDIGANLDEVARSEQLKRYLAAFPNLILTDYLEFRWYREGELCRAERLGRLTPDRSDVKRDSGGVVQVQELLQAFLWAKLPSVGTARQLACYMGATARLIRDAAEEALLRQHDDGALYALLEVFRDTLIPDLEHTQFADMYAQTITYGLFSASFVRHRRQLALPLTREELYKYLPKTNPFLEKLVYHITGPEMPDEVAWAVDELVQLLHRADMTELARDFGRRPGREDPVVHFYEDFLREYDPKERKIRGVYYTPEPVVSYIVRSIDYLLKEKFDKPLGLADKNVYILDPACGTGTFLYFVINQIKANLDEAGLAGTWSDYIKKHLLPRLFGFELLMTPYTIAHMKLAIQLSDLGYDFTGEERLGIYLTNSLEEIPLQARHPGLGYFLVEESRTATDIKRKEEIMVVLGNPPYSVSSANKGDHIENLMDRYKEAVRGERNIQPLSDDYIKFIRFAHDRIERTGYGIVGMITNHAWLSGLIHRGMREELMKTFPEIYTLDLHGNARIGETAPDGGKDENVFDIQQGVAISLMLRPDTDELPSPQIHHADLWGQRPGKNERLAETDVTNTLWDQLSPAKDYYFFVPRDLTLESEYTEGWSVADIFPVNSSGIKTHRDRFVIDFDRGSLQDRIAAFRNPDLSDDQIEDRFGLRNTRDWQLHEARSAMQRDDNWVAAFKEVLYRPFDKRWLCYHDAMLDWPRREVMGHMLQDNIALILGRAGHVVDAPIWHLMLVAEGLSDVNIFYRGGGTVFFLYLYPEEGTTDERRRPNLNPDFIKKCSAKLGLEFIDDGQADLTETFGPEDIFYYAYAVFHSPTYRERYAEFLKTDFPRLPLTSDHDLFAALVAKGKRLADLHLMRATGQIGDPPAFNIPGSNEVERVRYDEANQRVYINKEQYFAGVEPEVWEFQIGGYQVCQKWLKDRTIKKLGRPLSYDDITHYQKIVLTLRETRQLMKEIDEVIPGWPIE